MSCCTGFGCSNYTREQVDVWTNNIHNLLSNTNGRAAFQKYLLHRSFIQEERTVCFWEMVDEIQGLSRNASITEVHSKIKELIRFAIDEDINIDMSQMRVLKNCMREQDETVLTERLNDAKEWTINLLRERYKDFSRKLLEKYSRV